MRLLASDAGGQYIGTDSLASARRFRLVMLNGYGAVGTPRVVGTARLSTMRDACTVESVLLKSRKDLDSA